MRLGWVLILFVLGYGAWGFYNNRVDTSSLDYKTIEAKKIPPEWAEELYTSCFKSNYSTEKGKKICTCYTNGLLQGLSGEEFSDLHNATEIGRPAAAYEKIQKISADCQKPSSWK